MHADANTSGLYAAFLICGPSRPKQQHLPLPFTVVMDLESLQFPTPRLVTAATFSNKRVS